VAWAGFFVGEAGESSGSLKYPQVNDDASGAMLTPEDGDQHIRFGASGIILHDFKNDRLKRRAWAEKIDVECTLTAQRLVFSCAEYDKGGGWIIDGGTAMVLNAASKIAAAVRRHGKCMVGHVPFDNLMSIGFLSKRGLVGTAESLRLFVCELEGGVQHNMALDLTLTKGSSSEQLANQIARTVAAFRILRYPTMTDELRSTLQSIAENGITRPKNSDGYTRLNLSGACALGESRAP